MFRNLISGPGSSSGRNLHERLRVDLAQEFGQSQQDFELGSLAADLVIQQGPRVAVIEVKTGDPGQPLPSSTSSQMRLLAYQARQKFPEMEVLPVLITNYRVSEADEQELKDQGIKLVSMAESQYEPRRFSRHFAELAGLDLKIPG
jgi:hypothetical protein